MTGTLLCVGVPPAVLSQHLTGLVSAFVAQQPVCSCSWAQFEMAALEMAALPFQMSVLLQPQTGCCRLSADTARLNAGGRQKRLGFVSMAA